MRVLVSMYIHTHTQNMVGNTFREHPDRRMLRSRQGRATNAAIYTERTNERRRNFQKLNTCVEKRVDSSRKEYKTREETK